MSVAKGDKVVTLSVVDQVHILNALAVYEASVKRAAKSVLNPQIKECHETTARDLAVLVAKVAA